VSGGEAKARTSLDGHTAGLKGGKNQISQAQCRSKNGTVGGVIQGTWEGRERRSSGWGGRTNPADSAANRWISKDKPEVEPDLPDQGTGVSESEPDGREQHEASPQAHERSQDPLSAAAVADASSTRGVNNAKCRLNRRIHHRFINTVSSGYL